MIVNIKGLPKNEVLAALHAGTAALGMGKMHDKGNLTPQQAQEYINRMNKAATSGGDQSLEFNRASLTGEPMYFDYVCGRPIKIDLSKDEIDVRLYDRDSHTPGAQVIANLRQRLGLAA